MNRPSCFSLILASVFIITTASFVFSSPTKKYNLPTVSISKGFCCVNGRVVSTDRDTCLSKKGFFSSNKQKVSSFCVSKKLENKSQKSTSRPVKGYCCNAGDVTRVTSDICQGQKGYFSRIKEEAEKRCSETRGFCCKDGQFSSSSKGNCDRKNETFFINRDKGRKACSRTKGFCCVGGDVNSADKAECDRSKGSFFVIKKDADNSCSELKGYCCDTNRVYSVTKGNCDNRRGNFFLQKLLADKSCHINQDPKKTNTAGRLPKKTTVPGKFERKGAISQLSPKLLPDLHVLKTKINRSCYLTVEVKNGGGPVPVQDYEKATIHISAGPGNVLAKDKRYLRVIDPLGKLRLAGGTTIYTTDLKVTGKKSSLVWLDTGHHISESNEQNNGDYQELVCRLTAGNNLHFSKADIINKTSSTGKKKGKEIPRTIGLTPPQPVPGFKDITGLRVRLIGEERVRHPGEAVRFRVDLLGLRLPPFESPGYVPGGTSYRLYFHPANEGESSYEPGGEWSGWSVISRTEDNRSMTVEFRLPEAGIRFPEYDLTDEYRLSFKYGGESGSSGLFYVRPEGVEETGLAVLTPNIPVIWQIGSEQRLSWRVYGLEEPDTLVFSIKLFDGDTLLDLLRTDDVRCTGSSGARTCNKTFRVHESTFAAMAASTRGRDTYPITIEIDAKRRGSLGTTLASGRSAGIAVTEPRIEVVSPSAGNILTLYHPMVVIVRFSEGARGPARVRLHEPTGDGFELGLVECPACPSPVIQDVLFTAPAVYDEYFHSVGGDITGIRGFYMSVNSATEYLTSERSGDFSFRYPELSVASPAARSIMRNGRTETISWEFDIPYPTMFDHDMMVDIVLKNEATGRTWIIDEEVVSGRTASGLVGGELRWAVGDLEGNMNSYGNPRDLEPGRYSLRVESHNKPWLKSAWRVFNIITPRR